MDVLLGIMQFLIGYGFLLYRPDTSELNTLVFSFDTLIQTLEWICRLTEAQQEIFGIDQSINNSPFIFQIIITCSQLEMLVGKNINVFLFKLTSGISWDISRKWYLRSILSCRPQQMHADDMMQKLDSYKGVQLSLNCEICGCFQKGKMYRQTYKWRYVKKYINFLL